MWPGCTSRMHPCLTLSSKCPQVAESCPCSLATAKKAAAARFWCRSGIWSLMEAPTVSSTDQLTFGSYPWLMIDYSLEVLLEGSLEEVTWCSVSNLPHIVAHIENANIWVAHQSKLKGIWRHLGRTWWKKIQCTFFLLYNYKENKIYNNMEVFEYWFYIKLPNKRFKFLYETWACFCEHKFCISFCTWKMTKHLLIKIFYLFFNSTIVDFLIKIFKY